MTSIECLLFHWIDSTHRSFTSRYYRQSMLKTKWLSLSLLKLMVKLIIKKQTASFIVHQDINLVSHVTMQRASQKIWSCDQLSSYLGELFKVAVYLYLRMRKETCNLFWIINITFYACNDATVKKETHAEIIVMSLKSSHRIKYFHYSIDSNKEEFSQM